MAGGYRTPYMDDALRVDNGTKPDDIRQFIERRVRNPRVIEDIVVWNFNNHVLNTDALRDQADDLRRDEYVIPYQASGVWGYMVTLLPDRLQDAEILAYQQETGKYIAYPNYLRHSGEQSNEDFKTRLQTEIEGV